MQSLTNYSDQQLIHLFQDGDTLALETLIHRHKDKIYTVNLYTVTKYRYIVTFIGSIFYTVP